MPRDPNETDALRTRIAGIQSWYHEIDLGEGVVTPGHFRMADYVEHYRFPDLDGARVLDVGASNGFFSYEFERRGAAEVVAVELPSWAAHDWAPRYRREYARLSEAEQSDIDRVAMRDAFDIVGEALGSKRVRRVWKRIYDLDPDELGLFDVVFSGSMLMHVRDPILGIQRMRACCKPEGRLIVSVSTLPDAGDQPVAKFVGEWNQCNWWQMSPKCLEDVLRASDFGRIENRGEFVLHDVTGAFKDPTFVCHALPRREDEA